jgi:hypothetical protein
MSLVVAIISVLVGDSVGSGPGMDTDLLHSTASFIGEDAVDAAGFSVASAGDVNGDGYDDILIGARYNDDGGSDAGQTYLVLGKASGWSMDIDLSNADASFLGENRNDYSGYSVAGAGDVNGDGYDDILIGAPYNDEGGSDSGQTYLILGKESGWSMDTNLSVADASFYGEKPYDESGYSVASTGDVNYDGFDDLLIGAPKWGRTVHQDSGQTYLILGKASGWSLDTNLSTADASFMGGTGIHLSGCSVAGAGDVDGDGFDDILVGAFSGSSGGLVSAGATCLILGKASGWSMDAHLSDSNASFTGEASLDESGYSVAGVGDVNGDGFDDILIGARYNDDGGTDAGQTYLIYGKSSGWSMDTNLSTADASFLGENPNDNAGISVAGAGDVNDDGYNDMLIGAHHDDSGGSDAGQTYLILGRRTGWSMDTDLSSVDTSFIGEEIGDEAGYSVAGAGDINGDGYDDLLIGAPRSNDGGSDSGQTYVVFFDDGAPPTIVVDWTLKEATTGDPFTFNISTSDNTGVRNLSIELWYGDSDFHFNKSSSLSSGDPRNGTWVLNITIPHNSTEPLHYVVHVRDRAFYLTSSARMDVEVHDNDPPVVEDSTPSVATTGDDHTFSVRAMDNVNLTDVRVEYWFGENGTPMNVSMNISSRDRWILTVAMPPGSLDTLHYLIYAEDNSTNTLATAIRNVTMRDNDPPALFGDSTPLEATTGEDLTFSVHATDNINLSDVRVEYWYGDGGIPTNESMSYISDDLWKLTITIPSNFLDTLHYFFYAEDNTTNHATTSKKDLPVIDNDPPFLGAEETPGNVTTGDSFMFSIEAWDNIGIDDVNIVYWYGDNRMDTTNVSMERDEIPGDPPIELFWYVIDIPLYSLDPLHFRFIAIDSHGNFNLTDDRTVIVMDTVQPVLLEDLSDQVGTTGDPFAFRVRVSDNIGVNRVSVYHNIGGKPIREGQLSVVDVSDRSNSSFDLSVDVSPIWTGPIQYFFSIFDASGNELRTATVNVSIFDNDPPYLLASTDQPLGDLVKGLEYPFLVGVADDILTTRDAWEAHLVYWFADGPRNNVTMTIYDRLFWPPIYYTTLVEVPRDAVGPLNYFFTARDLAGNWNSTVTMSYSLVNSAPSFRNIPTWEITEGKEEVLDLSKYVEDSNDPLSSLVLGCGDDNIIASGLNLSLMYDTWLVDHFIEVWVSDGENVTYTNISVHVINVNDPPVIIGYKPSTGAKFKQGQRVTFLGNATDEDGDDLTYTWMVEGVVLGTGSKYHHSALSPGTLTITLVVNDGTSSTSQDITISIHKKQLTETTFFWVGVIVAVIVIAGISWTMRSRR